MGLLFVSLYFVLVGQTIQAGHMCPEGCTCHKVTMSCIASHFPDELPNNITSVYMKGFNFNSLYRGVFESASWKKLMFLDIQSERGNTILDYSFMGLNQLEHLGIHGNNTLYSIQQFAFDGLDKVHTLDLSDSYFLSLNDIHSSLDACPHSVLGSLRNISLAKLYLRVLQPNNLDFDFFKILGTGRSLKYLDISYLSINIADFEAFESLLCNSLKYVKAQKMTVVNPIGYFTVKTCSSLRTLDLTGTTLSIAQDEIDLVTTAYTCKYSTFYYNIENLYFSEMFKVDSEMHSRYLNMADCDFHFRKIVGRKNNIRMINTTVILSKSLRESLTELDLSDNSMRYLSPEAIYSSTSLQNLNLTSNQLFHMQRYYPNQFSRLLQKSVNLHALYIANNRLTNLPDNFLEANSALVYLDLSSNQLTSITFNIKPLKNLKFVDLSFNKIKSLQLPTLTILDDLNNVAYADLNTGINITSSMQIKYTVQLNMSTKYSNGRNLPTEKVLKINLGSNPLICSCSNEQLEFLKWLETSETVYHTSSYTCNFEGKALDILTPALSEVEEFCELQKRLKVIKVAIPVTIAVLVLVVLSALCVRRQFRRRQRYTMLLKHLKSNNYSKSFLVYLSYCSEDTDFVLTKIYPDLHSTLSNITENGRNFVCIGDRNFRPGQHITSEVARCMEDSAVVIFVVSNTFCKKGWCQSEVNEAYAQAKPIIMLMTEQVDTTLMPRFLNTIFKRYIHAAWVDDEDDGHLEPDVQILCEAILWLASNEGYNSNCSCLLSRKSPQPYIMNENVELQTIYSRTTKLQHTQF